MLNHQSKITEQKLFYLLFFATIMFYVSSGALSSFILVGIAPIIRLEQNIELKYLGFFNLLFLPISFAFLWAFLVDNKSFKFLGRRSSWFLPIQLIATSLVFLISFIYPQSGNWKILFLISFMVVMAVATVDLALDGFSVDYITSKHKKKYLASAKIASMALGTMIGSGLLVSYYDILKWQHTIEILAILQLFTFISFVFIGYIETVKLTKITNMKKYNASILNLIKNNISRERLIKISVFVTVLFFLNGLNRLLLIDMGVDLKTIGYILGVISPIINILISFLTAFIFSKLSIRNQIILVTIIAIFAQILIITGYIYKYEVLAINGSVIIAATLTIFYILLAHLVLVWAKGDQSATDYSLLFSLGRCFGLIIMIIVPVLANYLGWAYYLIFTLIIFILGVYYFCTLKGLSKEY